MALLVFDTHDFISELTAAGIPESHAVAISDGLKRVDLAHVATRSDVVELRADIAAVKMDVANARSDARVLSHEAKSSLLQWFTGMLVGQAALVAALVKLIEG